VTPYEVAGPRLDFLSGGGAMSARVRAFDWSSTPLGPADQWPQSLKTSVSTCLNSRFAILIWWGRQLIKIYNDAYAQILAKKHPAALGSPGREVWPEIWHIIGPMLEGVLDRGEATWSDNLLLELERDGYPEECYFTFSYSPIRDESGRIAGVFTPVQETTRQVIGERRLRTLRDLADAARAAKTQTIEEVCHAAAAVIAGNTKDIPFAAFYTLSPAGGQPLFVAGGELSGDISWLWSTAGGARRTDLEVVAVPEGCHHLPMGAWPIPPCHVAVAPLAPGGQTFGYLVAAISPRKRLDEDYLSFLSLVAGHVTTGMAEARAFQEERRRAEALAEIDRAKTAFFSNVSHEFRTPLTLMLGPLENILSQFGLGDEQREQIEIAHRNSLRLLKLVNSLLDFSRIEAGRVRARYVPTDLPKLTADLASNFRSALEASGLTLTVDCLPLAQPVFIDREMWEKIVLNLLSNAFKFTLQGGVVLRLACEDQDAKLTVSDTGVGIPEDELPRVFDRFHRVDGVHGRTYEGSGIGLALIQELVKLHGGSVSVASRVNEGSTFTVTIPFGSSHLPPEQVETAASQLAASPRLDAYTTEAMSWVAQERLTYPSKDSGARLGPTIRPRVLVVDDNADMREHITRILGARYDVTRVGSGEAALREAELAVPDLLLADVMMPGLDGFGLLREVRDDPKLREVPVILVSARAGEEARIEGLDAGADDYVTKPFSARELLARVEATLKLRKVRREARDEMSGIAARLQNALRAARMSAWDWDLKTGQVIQSDNAPEVLGTPVIHDETAGWSAVHPDDLARLRAVVDEAIRVTGDYQTRLRWVRPDNGAVQWMEIAASVMRDASGQAARVAGVLVDVSERCRVEALIAGQKEALERAVTGAPLADVLEPLAKAAEVQWDDVRGEMVLGDALDSTAPGVWTQLIRSSKDAVLGRLLLHHGTSRFPGDAQRNAFDYLAQTAALLIEHRRENEERLDATRRLQQRTAQFEILLHRAPIGLFVLNSNFAFKHVNPTAQAMIGVTANLVGRDFGEVMRTIWADDRAEDMVRTLRHVLKTGESYVNPEFTEQRLDRGVNEYYEWRADRIPLVDGRFGVVCYVRDISGQVRARETISLSEERFRMLASLITDVPWTTDPSGAFVTPQQKWEVYTGQTWDQHQGFGWLEAIHPDDRDSIDALWRQACETCTVYQATGRLWHAATRRWRRYVVRSLPLLNADGTVREWVGSHTDVEDEKGAADALQQSEVRFRTMANHAPVLIWMAGTDRKCTWFNDPWLQFTGRSIDQELGFAWTESVHPEDRDRLLAVYEENFQAHRGFSVECRLRRHDGEWRWILGNGSPLYSGDGFAGYIGSCTDITEMKRAEEVLRARTQELETLLDVVPVPVWNTADPRAMFVHGNRAASELFETVTGVDGSAWKDVLFFRDGRRLAPEELPLQRAVTSASAEREEELEAVLPGGRRIVLTGSAVPLVGADGKVRGGISALMDITARKQWEEQLRESEERLRLATKTGKVGVWDWNMEANSVSWTDSLYEMFGLDRGVNLDATLLTNAIHPDDRDGVLEATARTVRSGDPCQVTMRVFNTRREVVWLYASAIVVRRNGRAVRMLGATVDITELKRTEEELRRANRDLEQFAYSASHDLQEPLRSVTIYSELLTRRCAGKLDGDALEYLEFLRSGATRMEMLVRDLLAYTQATRLDKPSSPVDAGAALRVVLSNLHGAVTESSAQIEYDELPAVRVHATHLQQLFQNLVGNAIKYRRPGVPPLIHVSAECRDGSCVFAIRDNGIGIEPEYRERIFGLFKRLHTAEEYSGTGIGLAICHRIVERYDGRIWVESERGRGSTFYFTVPS
jgi:PAS domain S-box-containing protein